jgi:hypothetical protein
LRFLGLISAALAALGFGSCIRIAILARVRFGRRHIGVNRARLEKWLAALAPMQQEPGTAEAAH